MAATPTSKCRIILNNIPLLCINTSIKKTCYHCSCVIMATSTGNNSIKWTTQLYLQQSEHIWPKEGKHILAQYDDNCIVVYQAFCPEIAEYAVNNQKFGGPLFSYSRMSWVKTNFLWMMYRCGWAQKRGQERVLAVWITRDGFHEILSNAATSGDSDVRLQWDPDHQPDGSKETRRAIQLGLRNSVLSKYGNDWVVKIEDITEFVHTQYKHVVNKDYDNLLTAQERIYPINDQELAKQINMINIK